MEKLLIFTNGEKIGDGIIKLPFIYEIKKRLPHTKICWMTNKGKTVYNSRLKNFVKNYIDEIYESAELSPFFWQKISKKYNLENLEFDFILDTQKTFLRTMALKRIKTKLFISASASGFFSDKKIYNKSKYRKYYLDDLYDLLNLISIGEKTTNLRFDIPIDLENMLKNIFKNEFSYIGYAPGAGEKDKVWDINNYIKLIHHFENKKYKSVFFLGPDDENIKKQIKKNFPDAIYPEEIIDNFSGPEIVIGSSKFLKIALSNDSGVSHMLSTNNCHLIKLFGPKESKKFTPDSNYISTINASDFGGRDINLITVNSVIDKIEKKLS